MKVANALPRLKGVSLCVCGYVACCPAHDDHHPSLSVREAENGEAQFHCFAGCSYRAIMTALGDCSWREIFGIPSGAINPTRALDELKRIEYARHIWREARSVSGTLVETYLGVRGLTMPIPPSLRFHASLKHPSQAYLPAMVACVQAPSGKISGIHRTFLRPNGSAKANAEPQKMMLGRCAGGAVRLGPISRTITISEGIETGLSVAQAIPEISVWVALSSSGLMSINLPTEVREVFIAADRDENGAGERAAYIATDRLIRQDQTRIIKVVTPRSFGDWNDVLQGRLTTGG